ncbi:MAG TPA: hypothetical protein DC048_05445 [Planctomycetaceae bacterium]|nr:hypothetical protein [Planctomycetaceae bacterium]
MSDESSVPVSAASTQAPSARGGDAAYEAGQIAAIARWKSTAPSRLGAVIDTATAPVTWLVGHFIPRNAVIRLVTSMEEIAAKADSFAEVARVAGVSDIRELAQAPLAFCDRLALGFSARAERFAVVESTAFSLGGPLFHVPQQLIAALRSISRIGHCYGYVLDTPLDHAIVIDILEIAMLQDPVERQDVLAKLHVAIDQRAEEIEGEADLVMRTTRNMLAEEAFDFIPVVGTAVSFLFDCNFMHAVDETARRVFQERWLRDNGRVATIDPAAEMSRKSSFEEFGLALGQLMYTSGAILGFTFTLPGAVIRTLVGRSPNPVGRGARAGAERAVNDAREFLAGVRTSFETAGFDGAAFEAGTTPVANGAVPA